MAVTATATTMSSDTSNGPSGASPTQNELKQRLKVVMNQPDNQLCCDCGDKKPTWASLIVPPPNSQDDSHTLGALCCLHCSGAHRRLGVHICFVRSLTLDDWKEKEVISMELGGNQRINRAFEGDKDAMAKIVKPNPQSNLEERDAFIRAKFSERKFFRALDYRQITNAAQKEYIDIMSGNHRTNVAVNSSRGAPVNRRATMSTASTDHFADFSLEKNNFFSESKRSLFEDVVAPPATPTASKTHNTLRSTSPLTKSKPSTPTVRGGGGRTNRRNLMTRNESFRASLKALEGKGNFLSGDVQQRRRSSLQRLDDNNDRDGIARPLPSSSAASTASSSSKKKRQQQPSSSSSRRKSFDRSSLMSKAPSFRQAVEALEKEFVPPTRSRGRTRRSNASGAPPSSSDRARRDRSISVRGSRQSTSRAPASEAGGRRRGTSVRRGAARKRSSSRDDFEACANRSINRLDFRDSNAPRSRTASRDSSFENNEPSFDGNSSEVFSTASNDSGNGHGNSGSRKPSSSSRRRRKSLDHFDSFDVADSVSPNTPTCGPNNRSNSWDEIDTKPGKPDSGKSSSSRRRPPSSRSIGRNHSLDTKQLLGMIQTVNTSNGSITSGTPRSRKLPGSRSVSRNSSFNDSFNSFGNLSNDASDRRKPPSGRSVSRSSGDGSGHDDILEDDYFEVANDMRSSRSRKDGGSSSSSYMETSSGTDRKAGSVRGNRTARSSRRTRSSSTDRFEDDLESLDSAPSRRSDVRGSNSRRASSRRDNDRSKSPSRRASHRSPHTRGSSKSPSRHRTRRRASSRSPSKYLRGQSPRRDSSRSPPSRSTPNSRSPVPSKRGKARRSTTSRRPSTQTGSTTMHCSSPDLLFSGPSRGLTSPEGSDLADEPALSTGRSKRRVSSDRLKGSLAM